MPHYLKVVAKGCEHPSALPGSEQGKLLPDASKANAIWPTVLLIVHDYFTQGMVSTISHFCRV